LALGLFVALVLSLQAARAGDAPPENDPEATPEQGTEDSAPPLAGLEPKPSARLYLTNAERREVGMKHKLTPWLTVSGLVEGEWQSEALHTADSGRTDRLRERAASVQLGFIAEPWEFAKGELILEYDTVLHDVVADEAFVSLEAQSWEVEAGKLYTPLGVYISHFASGPLLEFAESRANGVLVSYAPSDALDLKLMAYRGRARAARPGSSRLDWAASVETQVGESWLFGLSFQSDLADSDERFLRDTDDRYARRVAGAGGYAVWTAPGFDLTFEVVGALRSFRELEDDRNQPVAWNVEFAHFFHRRFSWALRWEGSRELEDAPRQQVGVALTARIAEQASLTAEYLYGWFSGDLATSDDDERYDRVSRIGAILSIAF
jgi:hypothetical protein